MANHDNQQALLETTMKAAPEPISPSIPDLKLIRVIGHGGSGQVWLAQNMISGQLVAAKLIPFVAAGDMAGARANREIEALIRYESARRHNHEHLLQIYHVGKVQEFLFYLMDPADDVRGGPATGSDPSYEPGTLATVLMRAPATVDQCLTWAEQLLDALAFLHGHALTHRDVKPSNCVFLRGVLKLADFGLVTSLDSSMSCVGTPAYMPPDGRMDTRADVYAAGLVLYELLTNLGPSSFPRLPRNTVRLLQSDRRLIALNKLILRACSPDPTARFAHACDMLTEFRQVTFSPPPRKRVISAVRSVIAASVVAALLVICWPGSWRHHSKAEPAVHQPDWATVNFITVPFEAAIYIDGVEAQDAEGHPYRTPCTIRNISAARHHVTFRLPGRKDLDAGTIPFEAHKDIVGEW